MVRRDSDDLGSKIGCVGLLTEHQKRQTLRSRPGRSSDRGHTTTSEGGPATSVYGRCKRSLAYYGRCSRSDLGICDSTQEVLANMNHIILRGPSQNILPPERPLLYADPDYVDCLVYWLISSPL